MTDGAKTESLDIEVLSSKEAQTNHVNNKRFQCPTWSVTKAKLIKHHLPLGFLFVLIVALIFPTPGEEVKGWKVEDYGVVDTFNVFVIFLISGVTLRTEDVWAALRAYQGLLYGLLAILFITPCLGFGLIELPLSPDEFNIGLAIFAAVPTTLTSGVTLVTQAYGNGTLALMLTVVSNLIGILTVPFGIRLIVASGTDVEIDAVDLLIKLALTILVPLIIGKTLRELSTKIQTFVKNHKMALTLTSSANLICIVWQNLSKSRDELLDQAALDIFIIIMAGIALHLALLLINYMAVGLLRLDERERKAVLLMSSQKTLPVSVTVISYLNEGDVGDKGLLTIPCIVGHISQLFIDAFIVSRWASEYLRENPTNTV